MVWDLDLGMVDYFDLLGLVLLVGGIGHRLRMTTA